MPLFGHAKILHALVGMGSAALAAAVPYPGKSNTNFPQGTMKYFTHTRTHRERERERERQRQRQRQTDRYREKKT